MGDEFSKNNDYISYESNNWDKKYSELPTSICFKKFLLLKEIHDLLNRFLPIDSSFKSLEIGSGSGSWMSYFHNQFQYNVSGIDILKSSIKLSQKNLNIQKIPYDKLICADILTYSSPIQYDLVYSFGTIEHFDDPVTILRKMDSLVKKGGYLFIEVPHFNKINLFLSRIFQSKKSYIKYTSIHNLYILNLNSFRTLFSWTFGNSYEVLNVDIIGILDISLYNSKLFNKYSIPIQSFIYKNKSFFKKLNIRSLYPSIVYIARKK